MARLIRVHSAAKRNPPPPRLCSCGTVLCMPTGGKCKLTEGCDFRKKA